MICNYFYSKGNGGRLVSRFHSRHDSCTLRLRCRGLGPDQWTSIAFYSCASPCAVFSPVGAYWTPLGLLVLQSGLIWIPLQQSHRSWPPCRRSPHHSPSRRTCIFWNLEGHSCSFLPPTPCHLRRLPYLVGHTLASSFAPASEAAWTQHGPI